MSNSKPQPQRISRNDADLIGSLQRHVKLLKEFSKRAFNEGDYDYMGEIAAKLRLLVCERKQNKPLLLGLMEKFEANIQITLDGPPIQPPPGLPRSGDRISLKEFLNLPAYAIKAPSRGLAQLTKEKLIRIWAEQNGAAHEDWSIQEEFIILRDSGLFIGNHPAMVAELQTTTNAVLYVADKFLGMFNSEKS